MENENIKTIEINGVKLEVDLRTCRRIDTFKVGDNVKILKKEYNEYRVYSGVIIDFVNFKELPAIVVAYFNQNYGGVEINFETITKESKDIEIAPCLPHEMKINKSRVIDKFDLRIAEKMREADELRQKKEYFIKNFGKFFDEEVINENA